MKKITATLIGGAGYLGGEALRLLLGHPDVDLACVTGYFEHEVGRRVDELQPNLRGYTDLKVVKHDEAKPADVTFLALPHGHTAKYVPKKGKVVDYSGDFRLADRAVWEKFYKMEHPAWELQKSFAFGIPEINREAIRSAERVAVAGCFATTSILSLYPLTKAGLHAGRIIVDAKTGSSGSGVAPGPKTHHPFRSTSFFAYGSFTHRHQPEIEQAVGAEVLFQPHSAPMVRGILATGYTPLKKETTSKELLEIYRETYNGEPFIRLQEGSPNVNYVKGSNLMDIGVAAQGRTAITFGALDNLIKGGAGQGVQCMNLMFGLEETAGLSTAPANP